jgi:hypothetical protein
VKINRSIPLGFALGIFCAPAYGQVLFHDDFKNHVDPAWKITRVDKSYYGISAKGLDLRASADDIDVAGVPTAKNLFLIDNPTKGDFVATLKIKSFVPAHNNHAQIDVIALDDEKHLVRANYGHIHGQRQAEFGLEQGPSWTPQQTPVDLGDGTFFLRLKKQENVYSQSYSTDGTNYTTINAPRDFGDGTPVSVGFCAGADPSESSHVYIESFTVEVPKRGQ